MFFLLIILLNSTLFVTYCSCLEAIPINKVLRPKITFTEKIFGGSNASVHNYPSIVSVLGNGYQMCGGTIISRTTVLSAAHCFYKRQFPMVYTIRANSTYATKGGTIHAIKKVIIHDKFEDVYLSFDFAVAITRSAFRYYQIAQLTRAPVTAGSTVFIAGWGATEKYQTMDTLQHAKLTIISEHKCISWLQEYNIKKSMLCAASLVEGVDTCTGDSGGPLYYGKKLAGVTSWGISCGQRFPGVYGNVSHVVRWLDQFG